MQIRRNRLQMIARDEDTDYVDLSVVREEVAMARRLCTEHGWPIIDVTRRSIEETAATIIQMLQDHRDGNTPSGGEAASQQMTGVDERIDATCAPSSRPRLGGWGEPIGRSQGAPMPSTDPSSSPPAAARARGCCAAPACRSRSRCPPSTSRN